MAEKPFDSNGVNPTDATGVPSNRLSDDGASICSMVWNALCVSGTATPNHAYPRQVHFVDELPETPSGKVQRYVLRQT